MIFKGASNCHGSVMFCFGFLGAWSSQACVCTYRCMVWDGRAVSAPYGGAVVGSRLAFLLRWGREQGSHHAGRGGKGPTPVLPSQTTPWEPGGYSCLLGAEGGVSDLGHWREWNCICLTVFKGSASTTEPLKGRGMMLLNCLKGRGKKSSSLLSSAEGKGDEVKSKLW